MQSEKTTFPKDVDKKNKANDELNQDFNPLNQASGDLVNRLEARHDIDLRLFKTQYETRTLYIYQIYRLYANKENNVKFSPNTIKIGFINPDEVIVTTGYEITNYSPKLTSRNTNNVNDNQTVFEMPEVRQLQFQKNALPHNNQIYVLSLDEPVSTTNLDNLYVINDYNEPWRNPKVRTTKIITITKVNDWTTNNGYPMIVRIQKQLTSDTKITGIKIKYPQPALFGNIKLLGEANGVTGYDKAILSDDYINFPLLSMPIETDPKVRLLQWWFSDQILPWELAKQFITEKSVLDLINIEPGTETRKEVIPNARVTEFELGSIKGTQQISPPWPLSGKMEFVDKQVVLVASYETGPSSIIVHDFIATSSVFRDIELEIQNAPLINSLSKILLEMLSYTFNYYRNFNGANEIPDDEGNFNNITLLKQKFNSQKPEDVITNLYKQWELDNPDYKNNTAVKLFKIIILMLSKNILSKLSINTGLNDDYKILLPYYFELVSSPLHASDGDTWDFKDCKVILKSEYFNFSEVNGSIIVTMKNKDLSQNKLFHLDENQFNWLSITNELESNAIPSLLPYDWKLSDGEFAKYFTNLIIKKTNIESCLSLYGKLNSTLYSKFQLFNIFENIISNDFILNNEKPLDSITGIEISGIFGNGNYDLILLTNDNKEIAINNLNLFSKNEKISLIQIEI